MPNRATLTKPVGCRNAIVMCGELVFVDEAAEQVAAVYAERLWPGACSEV